MHGKMSSLLLLQSIEQFCNNFQEMLDVEANKSYQRNAQLNEQLLHQPLVITTQGDKHGTKGLH